MLPNLTKHRFVACFASALIIRSKRFVLDSCQPNANITHSTYASLATLRDSRAFVKRQNPACFIATRCCVQSD